MTDVDTTLVVSFEPDAIRDSFDLYDDDDECKQFVDQADDETLKEIAQECLDSDVLWRTFHDLIEESVKARV